MQPALQALDSHRHPWPRQLTLKPPPMAQEDSVLMWSAPSQVAADLCPDMFWHCLHLPHALREGTAVLASGTHGQRRHKVQRPASGTCCDASRSQPPASRKVAFIRVSSLRTASHEEQAPDFCRVSPPQMHICSALTGYPTEGSPLYSSTG